MSATRKAWWGHMIKTNDTEEINEIRDKHRIEAP